MNRLEQVWLRSGLRQYQRDYSIVYNRGRKRKASVLEADVGVDDNMVRELFPSNNQVEESAPSISVPDSIPELVPEPIFEPSLPTIPKESSEDIQVTPDAVMSGAEATTSRGNRQFGAIIDDSVRPFAESATFKVNNSLAQVGASMLVCTPSKIKGFYDDYDKSFCGPMAIAKSPVMICHIGAALRGLLEMQL
ncbi:uncharacterized protein [Henckelia pumila]|uniref:uncharacterized protein n=1 Tax=Henckelia pumila TaxID=405737 RepID=UPI003C6DD933